MNRKTIHLAFQLDSIRVSLANLHDDVINSDISEADKARFFTSLVALKRLSFIPEAIDYAFDDYIDSMADNFRGFEVKHNENC